VLTATDVWLHADLLAVEPFRMLDPNGELCTDSDSPLTADEILDALRLMLLSRAFDERATAMNRQGRFGGFAPASGQEACLAGSAMALDPARDWIVPQYRELPALVRHGYPLERLAAFSLGKPDAARVPEGVRALPLQFALAAQLPHAVGLAWGRMLRGEREVVLTYCGEGATSEGDFHEACNLAGVLRAPVVFVVQNNGWAISTPRSLQSAAASFAVRALGYGMAGVLVDGNDLLAVHQVTREAVERARSGGGPSLIEAQTYRLGVHNMTDDPRRYQVASELESARDLDPVRRVQRHLRSLGRLDADGEAELWRDAMARAEAAIAAAHGLPAQSPADVFEHVYASRPPALERQRGAAAGR
jgi:pyruvate dehydrogenase E1 component alpha subunit